VLKRLFFSSAIVALAALSAGAQNPAPAPAAGIAALHGTVMDSLHGSVLVGALVRVDNSTHEGFTDSTGRYRIDSIPAGMHRLVVVHPLLDTLGIW
jgi:hypothetical protein